MQQVWLRHSPTVGGGCFGGNGDIRPARWDEVAATLPATITELEWVCSPLKRAQQTAAALKKALGYKGVIKTEPAIAEQHFGKWEGLTHQQVQTRYPDEYQALWDNPAQFTPPEGESFSQLFERVANWYKGGITTASFFVAHSGSIQVIKAIRTRSHTPPQTSIKQALAFTIPHLTPFVFD